MIENGVNALDLVDSPPVTTTTLTRAVAILQANYGTDYSAEKIAVLFDMIRDEGWTEHRFNETLKWFLKNKTFPAWTVSDWFNFSVKIFPYEWYARQVSGGMRREDFDRYVLPDGIIGYRIRDGITLPFPIAPAPVRVA